MAAYHTSVLTNIVQVEVLERIVLDIPVERMKASDDSSITASSNDIAEKMKKSADDFSDSIQTSKNGSEQMKKFIEDSSDSTQKSKDGSKWIQGRVPHQLPPLQVEKYSSSYGSGAAPPLSPDSEAIVQNRIQELSQLESPLLRELAKRLGNHFYIGTPRYVSKPKQHCYSHLKIGDRWEEIQGSHNWSGLLDPIDEVLRGEIVRYGEFAEACYDAFDGDKDSKFGGSAKHKKSELLEKCALQNRGYEVTDYIYATSEIPLPSFFLRSREEDPWSKDSNWIGYVAVCTSTEEIARLGRRDIVIAFRGTSTSYEWIEDIRDFMSPAGFDPRKDDVMVERGFLSVYTSSNSRSRYNKLSAREQVLHALKILTEKYKGEKLSITVTGHSLGSAVATLCAYDIAETGMNKKSAGTPKVPNSWYTSEDHRTRELSLWDLQHKDREESHGKSIQALMLKFFKDILDGKTESSPKGELPLLKGLSKFHPDRIPVTVYSFAGPKVGNSEFVKRMEELGVAVLRVANVNDVVTSVPGIGVLENPLGIIHSLIKAAPSYQHVGVVLEIDNRHSPYLEETGNPADTHSLEGYLHLVDGYHGRDKPFKITQRDIALVNKRADFLKPEHFIPPLWWQEENKGMIRDENGHWILKERDPELFPPTPNNNNTDVDKDLKGFLRSVSIAIQRSVENENVSLESAGNQ
ncbi:hypothetical protein R1sor_017571 [Riccia sorocarpa]|uniref:Fungal lipase-type domain-containing protein n=1 Tax=Riccia sorocarpa TaxID=122646 RepID=A0ABD3I918_9MARC